MFFALYGDNDDQLTLVRGEALTLFAVNPCVVKRNLCNPRADPRTDLDGVAVAVAVD